ncbi:hypothetical protein K469DRAFT_719915 [Zopfia rhizophila CBS 207.26]|uniref:SAM domain-containing protein n=1 Tax=Zopfia rhizophila CBS 207.26 TaxID=1314779 RepID=A0A6A6ELG7_9PEZI|nr:hypothetical protein K469DRAFT_719915 [Zopfia rhizophila CBS 207.26]
MDRRVTSTRGQNTLNPSSPNGQTPRATQVDILYNILASIGLQYYFRSLLEAGFDSWCSVCRITELDLERLSFKLGHRRLLQRRIADSQGYPRSKPLPNLARTQRPASSSGTETLSYWSNSVHIESGREADGYASSSSRQESTESGSIVESIERDS